MRGQIGGEGYYGKFSKELNLEVKRSQKLMSLQMKGFHCQIRHNKKGQVKFLGSESDPCSVPK